MKGFSLTQPWASLVDLKAKQLETRSWYTSYRGPLVICAAKGYPKWAQDTCGEQPFFDVLQPHFRSARDLPVGVALCLVNLLACVKTTELHKLESLNFKPSVNEIAFGDYSEGRYAWLLEHVRSFPTPIPVKGALGLWEWSAGIAIPEAA
jgi:activating signal cointegrator 1